MACENCLAGLVGVEPTVHATQERSHTTWQHPSSEKPNTQQMRHLQGQK